ncbi:hypothetical protein SYNPS1DRAFT_31912 [Syncephalis pseudoplumigaleata]|uniref:Uncharacterized protein n=1 Tax=Syncephalis pseudoplumigaleata TaxID=1712513 RepID=A0A4P9YRJ9_9FUNG|nr:hypothetical protein SYNPS1DRAFT_31912 [Syncephalis pseudoplumigaleata]|eukprot:RKP22486.1 hypothetical protein SYNPS1DRAFT_31912 [Syncephalis pseudoplumigaleata]
MRLALNVASAAVVGIMLMDAMTSAALFKFKLIFRQPRKYAQWLPEDKKAVFGTSKFTITEKMAQKSWAVDYFKGKLDKQDVTIACIPKSRRELMSQDALNVQRAFERLARVSDGEQHEGEQYIAHPEYQYEANQRQCYVTARYLWTVGLEYAFSPTNVCFDARNQLALVFLGHTHIADHVDRETARSFDSGLAKQMATLYYTALPEHYPELPMAAAEERVEELRNLPPLYLRNAASTARASAPPPYNHKKDYTSHSRLHSMR